MCYGCCVGVHVNGVTVVVDIVVDVGGVGVGIVVACSYVATAAITDALGAFVVPNYVGIGVVVVGVCVDVGVNVGDVVVHVAAVVIVFVRMSVA